MKYDDKTPDLEIQPDGGPEARQPYVVPTVETIARGEYMALLGSGSACSATPPTQNQGPAIDGCNLT